MGDSWPLARTHAQEEHASPPLDLPGLNHTAQGASTAVFSNSLAGAALASRSNRCLSTPSHWVCKALQVCTVTDFTGCFACSLCERSRIALSPEIALLIDLEMASPDIGSAGRKRPRHISIASPEAPSDVMIFLQSRNEAEQALRAGCDKAGNLLAQERAERRRLEAELSALQVIALAEYLSPTLEPCQHAEPAPYAEHKGCRLSRRGNKSSGRRCRASRLRCEPSTRPL